MVSTRSSSSSTAVPTKRSPSPAAIPTTPRKRSRKSSVSESAIATPKESPQLRKKLKQLESYLQTPFPDFARPTYDDCKSVKDALESLHGLSQRPQKIVVKDDAPAGCGEVPSVLDALVRTILSQNTTSANSTRAKHAIDKKYGFSNYQAVHEGSVEELAQTITCGGLANVKAKAIKKMLQSVQDKRGELSLDYLHSYKDLDAMRELVSFDGVGPKTASCVLLFCLGRESFAVDTHVFRITKALGWTPPHADRETAFQHLDVRIPGEFKYALHSLFVRHGRHCNHCAAAASSSKSDKPCPIKHFMKVSPGKIAESPSPKKRKGGKPKKEEDEKQVKIEEALAEDVVAERKGEVKEEIKAEDVQTMHGIEI